MLAMSKWRQCFAIYSLSPKMLFSMFVDTVMWKPKLSKTSRICLALSEWQTIVVRASVVNRPRTYFSPTATMSSIDVDCIRRIFAWLMSVMRLPRRKHTVWKFSSTTVSMLFSCSTNSKINELLADSSNVGSHIASADRYDSYKSIQDKC